MKYVARGAVLLTILVLPAVAAWIAYYATPDWLDPFRQRIVVELWVLVVVSGIAVAAGLLSTRSRYHGLIGLAAAVLFGSWLLLAFAAASHGLLEPWPPLGSLPLPLGLLLLCMFSGWQEMYRRYHPETRPPVKRRWAFGIVLLVPASALIALVVPLQLATEPVYAAIVLVLQIGVYLQLLLRTPASAPFVLAAAAAALVSDTLLLLPLSEIGRYMPLYGGYAAALAPWLFFSGVRQLARSEL